jgi:hypothetical protein
LNAMENKVIHADLASARAEFQQIIDLNPRKTSAWMELIDLSWWDAITTQQPLEPLMAIYRDGNRSVALDQRLEVLFVHAAWLLLAGQQEEYDRLCRLMAAEHSNTNDPRTKFLLSWLLALSDQPVIPPEQLLEIAFSATAGDPGARHHRESVALCLMRAGKFEQAIEYFDGNPFGIALAEANAGNFVDAKRYAHQAITEIPIHPLSDQHQHSRVAWRLYMHELNQLIGEQSVGPSE